MLSGFEQALLAVLILVLMTGMGATLTPASFAEIVRRPRGVLIGLASQFGWMPLIAFALARSLELPADLAIGLIVVGCTPGGTTSNMFTYYARADLALSITMTATSTIVAVVAMPLTLYVYASGFTGEALTIPYGKIVQTLLVVLLPVALGMWIRSRSERAARITERVGSSSGIAVLVLLVVSSLVRNGGLLLDTSGRMYLAAIGLGILGLVLGYAAAAALKLDRPARRAVSLETGIQNSPLALGIIIASFAAAQHQRVMWLPLLYALFVLISSTFVTLWFRRTSARERPA